MPPHRPHGTPGDASGFAITLCDGTERGKLRDVERLIRRTLPVSGEAQAAPKPSLPMPPRDIAGRVRSPAGRRTAATRSVSATGRHFSGAKKGAHRPSTSKPRTSRSRRRRGRPARSSPLRAARPPRQAPGGKSRPVQAMRRPPEGPLESRARRTRPAPRSPKPGARTRHGLSKIKGGPRASLFILRPLVLRPSTVSG